MRLTTRMVRQLLLAKSIYLRNPDGVNDVTLAALLRVSKTTAWRYRQALNTFEVAPGRYTMRPTADDILYAHIILQRVTEESGGNPHKPSS